jgi:hypothetical protein
MLGAAVCAFAEKQDPQGSNSPGDEDNGPLAPSVFSARGQDHSGDAKTGSARSQGPNMTYHGGKVMTTGIVQAIFWRTSWSSAAGDKITGLDSFYQGFSGSNYAKTSDEYTGSNGQVGPFFNYLLHIIDNSQAAGGSSAQVILNEVCKLFPQPDISGNGYYAVYSDVPRGNAGYCAWHSAGYCNGRPLQFAFLFRLDGDPGCEPQSNVSGESQGLAALANVSAHELSEARSDPFLNAWYDASGSENGDKCA